MAITKKFLKYSSNKIYYCHSTTTYANAISAQYRTIKQIHTECEISLLLKGSVKYVIEDNTYDIKEGDVVLVPPKTFHHTIVDTSKEYERIALEFPPELLPKLPQLDLLTAFTKAKAHFYTVPAQYAQKADIAKLLLDFKRYCNSKDKYRDITLAKKIISIVKNLHSISEDLLAQAPVDTQQPKAKVSQLCVDFIHENMDKNVTVQMIADALFISPSHLLHQFKKEMDITLHQYIVMQKAQTAETLLLQGANPLEVAKQLGYEYYSTFYNNFVKYRGHPPSKKVDFSPHSQKNIIE